MSIGNEPDEVTAAVSGKYSLRRATMTTQILRSARELSCAATATVLASARG